MGQHQLLTMLLATIIIGIAIVRGMDMFAQDHRSAQEDQIREQLLNVATHAQDWYRRPAALGGGGRSFAGISWTKLNITAQSIDATFTMSNKQQGSFEVNAVSKEYADLTMTYVVYLDSLALK